MPITAGNTAPDGDDRPAAERRRSSTFGDQVKYKVTSPTPRTARSTATSVQDPGDPGPRQRTVTRSTSTPGCEGTIQTAVRQRPRRSTTTCSTSSRPPTPTRAAPGDAQSLTGRAQVILQPKHKQAEHFSATGRVAGGTGTDAPGVQAEATTDPQGGNQNIGFIKDGDYWSLHPDQPGRHRPGTAPGRLGRRRRHVRSRRATPAPGPLVGTVDIAPTGGWQTYQDVTVDLTNVPATTGPLFFIVRKPASAANDAYLLNVNWVDFIGQGVTDNQRPTVDHVGDPGHGHRPAEGRLHLDRHRPRRQHPAHLQVELRRRAARRRRPRPTRATPTPRRARTPPR